MAIVREGEGYLAVENVPLLDSSLPIATSLDPLKNNTFRITRFDLKKKKKKRNRSAKTLRYPYPYDEMERNHYRIA